ncbi:MAG: hypothetical protein PWP65_1861 [Clostridia bacterium]|nr:hypothetical protein [Clostridia bacterium]
MVSTVTTTTVTTIASTSLAAGLGLVAVICLIALLIAKELADAAGAEIEANLAGAGLGLLSRAQALGRTLSVAIVPLLLVFGFIVLVKIMEVLAA